MSGYRLYSVDNMGPGQTNDRRIVFFSAAWASKYAYVYVALTILMDVKQRITQSTYKALRQQLLPASFGCSGWNRWCWHTGRSTWSWKISWLAPKRLDWSYVYLCITNHIRIWFNIRLKIPELFELSSVGNAILIAGKAHKFRKALQKPWWPSIHEDGMTE